MLEGLGVDIPFGRYDTGLGSRVGTAIYGMGPLPTPTSGSSLLLEDGSSFLLLEDGVSFLLLEASN